MAQMQVKYVGTTSDFRGLTEEDLKGWGITVDLPPASPLARRYVQDHTWCEPLNRPLDPAVDLVWGPHNGHSLTLDVSPELEGLLRQQGHFLLNEVKDSGETGAQVAAPSDISHPGDKQVSQVEEQPKQVSESPREEVPVDRPDPEWEAMLAAEKAARAETGEVPSGGGSSDATGTATVGGSTANS